MFPGKKTSGNISQENIMFRVKVIKFLPLMILQLVIFATTAWSAPLINEVHGLIQNGQSINITGSGFGNGPKIAIFDDFESGTTGSLVPTGKTVVGAWSEFGANHAFYTDTASISGSKSLRTDNSLGYQTYAGVNFPSTTEVFASWWMYLPPGTNIPGDGTTSGRNWKVTWIQGSSTTDDDHTLPTILADSSRIGSNAGAYNQYVNFPFKVGQWLRVSAWINAGTPGQANGAVRFTTLNSSGSVDQVNVSNVKVLPAGGSYERVRFNGYGRQTSNSYPTFDDVYAAIGPNAQARVEIGNAPSYKACTKLALITPTSWGSTQITATVRNGAFNTGDKSYLFIVDANGNPSSGYGPLTFGNIAGSGTVPPPPADGVPSIAITSPSSTGTYVASSDQVTISGNTADDKGISRVTWSANLGGNGTADNLSGDWTSWSISNLGIVEGDNIVTITTTDTIGQTASQTINITRNSSVPARPSPPTGLRVVSSY
jgi:hypothetical protein